MCGEKQWINIGPDWLFP